MKRPTLTIGVRAGVPPLYALKGWEELDYYARLNHPLWHAVRVRCLAAGLSEGDSLKMLCAALLEESENQRATIERYVAEVGTLSLLPLATDPGLPPPDRDLKPGEPCDHPGCLSHRTHPCESCGRVAGDGYYYVRKDIGEPWNWRVSLNTKLTGAERPV